MSAPAVGHSDNRDAVRRAHRCSFQPDRQDPYLRLDAVTVFVRDLERSLRFFLDQLGFEVALDTVSASGDRLVAAAPPDGTAILALTSPKPGSEESKLIGRPTGVTFLTDNVAGKYEEWRQRGVGFSQGPHVRASGGMSATFADVDGNTFLLLDDESAIREIEQQRREHVERLESERVAALELENAREVQARLFPQTQP